MKATSCGVFYFAVQGGSNFWVLTYCPFLWFCSDKVVLTFESLGGILSETVQMKSTEQYFPVVLFTMLYKVVLTFESVDEILKCDHSNESYWADFPVVLFIMLYKVVLTFESVDEIPKCDDSNESYWAVLFNGAVCFRILLQIQLKLFLNFDFVCSWELKLWDRVCYNLLVTCKTSYQRQLPSKTEKCRKQRIASFLLQVVQFTVTCLHCTLA